jgi:hypothetical protein
MAYLYLTFAAEISLTKFTMFSISETYHKKHGDLNIIFKHPVALQITEVLFYLKCNYI